MYFTARRMAAILAVGMLGLTGLSQESQAASAVSVDKDKGVYAYRVDQLLGQAMENANLLCRENGGQSCSVIVSCSLPGQGAVAFQRQDRGLCGQLRCERQRTGQE